MILKGLADPQPRPLSGLPVKRLPLGEWRECPRLDPSGQRARCHTKNWQLTENMSVDRERQFWDANCPTIAQALAGYEEGPDPNTRLMMDSLEPLEGRTVLDIACGAGITSAWLSARGASVTGIDISPKPLETARGLAHELGIDSTFIEADVNSGPAGFPIFDRAAGRFALHHLHLPSIVPFLAAHIETGGVAAFVETTDSNVLLRLCRRYLVGRFGIQRCGTLDEHPLTRSQMTFLRSSFGELEIRLGQMQFLRILDRQILSHRIRAASRLLGRIDDWLAAIPGTHGWSYHQVLVLTRPLSPEAIWPHRHSGMT